MSKLIGIEINEDGGIAWRINGGMVERRYLYTENPRWESVGGNAPKTASELKAWCAAENCTYAAKRVARIFEEPTGKYHICDDGLDYLDARGCGYDTKSQALRAAARGYTHATGSGCPWKGIKSLESYITL